jgi:exosortase
MVIQEQTAGPKVTEPETPGARPDWPTFALLAVSAIIAVVTARVVLTQWFSAYFALNSFYVYGPAIPFLVGGMFWHRRDALRAVPKAPSFAALPALIGSLGLLLLGIKHDLATVASLGLLGVVWSGVWLMLGSGFVRAAAFPLLFLAWMDPLPGPLLHEATFGSQQLSTDLTNHLLHILQFPTVLHGNVITLDSFSLFVEEPCSGFMLLLTLLVISSAFAWLADGSQSRRLLLFALSLPLAITDNVFRLTLLAIVGDSFGARAEHVIHDPSGLAVVGLGLLVLFWIARRMGCRTFAGLPLF